ncbi:hypothetical protein, partial [Faecalicatena contorta]|uniref:hypothetical protein n=1 Tax=Faecalicatena contorta TaxID=39482 RepID=UPI0031D41ACA
CKSNCHFSFCRFQSGNKLFTSPKNPLIFFCKLSYTNDKLNVMLPLKGGIKMINIRPMKEEDCAYI